MEDIEKESKILAENPNDTGALINRATLNFGLKHYEESIADTTKIIELNKEYLDQAYALRGMNYLMTKGPVKNAAAYADLLKAKELGYKGSDNPDILNVVCN